MTDATQLSRIIKAHGKHHQIMKSVEEFSETTTAIHRYSQSLLPDRFEDMAEELADAMIMFDQLKIIIPNLEKRVSFYRKLKLKRELLRIRTGIKNVEEIREIEVNENDHRFI